MKARYLYFAAAVGFLVGAGAKVVPPRNLYAASLDAITAAIFLVCAIFPRPPKS